MEKTGKKKTGKKKRVLIVILIVIGILISAVVIFLLSGKLMLNRNVAADCGVEPATDDYDLENNGSYYRYRDRTQVYLVMGIDKEGSVADMQVANAQDGGQADFLLLVSVDDAARKIEFTTINRNFIAPIDMYEEDGTYMGRYDAQLTVAHGFGDGKEQSCIREAEAVSRFLYGVPINGYVSLNLGAISVLTDIVGGVTVETSLFRYDGLDNRFADGLMKMDGEVAHEFLKYRDVNTEDSSTNRLDRQKYFIKAWAQQALKEIKKDPTLAYKIVKASLNYMVTDIPMNSMAYLLTKALTYDLSLDDIESLPGQMQQRDGFEAYYKIEPDFTDKVIERFFTQIDYQP